MVDSRVMLQRNDHGCHSDGRIVLIGDGNLRFSIRAQPWCSGLQIVQPFADAVRQHYRQGQVCRAPVLIGMPPFLYSVTINSVRSNVTTRTLCSLLLRGVQIGTENGIMSRLTALLND